MGNHERPTFPVGIDVFVVRDGKLLLGKRTGTGWSDGTWGLPGGHLEQHENMAHCAARELLEETGMTADGFEMLSVVNESSRQERHYIQVNFLTRNPKGEPERKEPHKCEEWRWFPLGELPSDIYPPHVKSIELFMSQKSNFADN